jgi:hypothetical protein
MKSLLSTCEDIDTLFSFDQPLLEFELHAPLLSLPYLVGTELETIPNRIPYLRAPKTCSLSAAHQIQLDETGPMLKVGLVWAPKDEYKRYCPLKYFEAILVEKHVRFFSLYKGKMVDELLPYRGLIKDLGSHFKDFGDTAWAIERLDLVITVDTAVAHLAGAMGKPTWVLLPCIPEWRWLLDREDSPWYPGVMRLFRQSSLGAWKPVLGRVAAALETKVARKQDGLLEI